jgi:hypothetical protein
MPDRNFLSNFHADNVAVAPPALRSGHSSRALVSFASARVHDLDNARILAEILECLEGFISDFKLKFSREDLVHLEYSLNRVSAFHKPKPVTSEENLRKAKELLKRIKAKINCAFKT